MPDSPTTEIESAFACDCERWMRSACSGEPFYKEREGKRYCVLHLPEKEKSEDFARVLGRKVAMGDFDFAGVWFPDDLTFRDFHFSSQVNFERATFSAYVDFADATFAELANFLEATFDGTAYFHRSTFKRDPDFTRARFSQTADFGYATFSEGADFAEATFTTDADFHESTFGNLADFRQANFHKANFQDACFETEAYFLLANFGETAYFYYAVFTENADFGSATFSGYAAFSSATFSAEADFSLAVFERRLNLSKAIFKDFIRFSDSQARKAFSRGSSLDLQFARFEKPDRFSFHSLTLRPHWFLNVDSRKFEFINVEWSFDLKREISDLPQKDSSVRLLAIACRNLALNAEESHRYEEGSRFRYLAMEVRRRAAWHGFVPWRLGWWYWLGSGYGERVLQAFLVLLSIWFVAGLLYTRVGFVRWEPKVTGESDLVSVKRDEIGGRLKLSRALAYSAGVMTFQKPEPRPATPAAQALVLLESILGPIQAALLALAIRRKFMR